MSMRLQRVERMLREALADILLRGSLRDPRLRDIAGVSITAVKVAPDMGQAQVYVDVLSASVPTSEILAGLNAGASAIRARLGGRIRLKRTPALQFIVDDSIEQGRKIEAVLAEIRAQEQHRRVSWQTRPRRPPPIRPTIPTRPENRTPDDGPSPGIRPRSARRAGGRQAGRTHLARRRGLDSLGAGRAQGGALRDPGSGGDRIAGRGGRLRDQARAVPHGAGQALPGAFRARGQHHHR
ncbi:MAG: 30S ribosome-binding factor RbfA [Deltaproteobacteria bacterium]|nr:30S ribosome-binding factor RbfA [Deltaproteobacteria bacterium]